MIEKHIFYSYEKLFDINAVVIEIKAIYRKMLKWAVLPILGAKRPQPFGTKRPEMGQNGHYGAKRPVWYKTHHFSIIMGIMINNNYPFGYI